MTKYIDTKSYRAASEKATISVTKYTDTNLGPHYFCRVYPDKLKGDYYQGLLVVAGSRDDAAREAALEFNALYPNAEQIQL